ncbi:MAG TPA: YbhB/YbcL family Raf kinase inhibitor-like protein [Polyangiaceae bacterium]
MTPIASIDHSDTEKRIGRLMRTGPVRALLLSLCCVFVQCGGGSTDSNSSQTSGGTNTGTGTGGVTSVGGTVSGGSNATGGAQSTVSGGASTVNSSVASGGTPQSTSSVGTAPAGGTGGTKTNSAGGATTAGGSSGLGGAAVTGGAAGASTKSGVGGKSSSGGATLTGGASGIGGKSNPGSSTIVGGGASSNGGKSSTGGAGGATGGTFTVTSPGWTNTEGCSPDAKTSCSPLPTAMTRSGAGTSPELHWTGAPEGTKSFVVLLQDLNNSTAHWILWNIPATVTSLAANVDQTTATPATPAGSQQCGKGTDAATDDGYYGPGAPCNVYELVVYALSIATFSPTTPKDPEAVRTQLKALGASILGTTSIRGRTNTGC